MALSNLPESMDEYRYNHSSKPLSPIHHQIVTSTKKMRKRGALSLPPDSDINEKNEEERSIVVRPSSSSLLQSGHLLPRLCIIKQPWNVKSPACWVGITIRPTCSEPSNSPKTLGVNCTLGGYLGSIWKGTAHFPSAKYDRQLTAGGRNSWPFSVGPLKVPIIIWRHSGLCSREELLVSRNHFRPNNDTPNGSRAVLELPFLVYSSMVCCIFGVFR